MKPTRITPDVTLVHSSKHPDGEYSKRHLQLWSDGVKTARELSSLAQTRHEAQVRAQHNGKPLADWQRYPHEPSEWGGVPEPPNQIPLMSISEEAADLMSIALKQRLWHESEGWRELLLIERILVRELIAERRGNEGGRNWSRSITRLTVLRADQTQQSYYQCRYDGAGMGPGGDGDEDCETVLLRNEPEAQAWLIESYDHDK